MFVRCPVSVSQGPAAVYGDSNAKTGINVDLAFTIVRNLGVR